MPKKTQALLPLRKLYLKTWGDPGLEAVVIDGFSMLAKRYNGSLNDEQASKVLSETHAGVKGFVGQAEQLRLKTGATKAQCIAAIAVNRINSTRHGKSKIPTWFKQ